MGIFSVMRILALGHSRQIHHTEFKAHFWRQYISRLLEKSWNFLFIPVFFFYGTSLKDILVGYRNQASIFKLPPEEASKTNRQRSRQKWVISIRFWYQTTYFLALKSNMNYQYVPTTGINPCVKSWGCSKCIFTCFFICILYSQFRFLLSLRLVTYFLSL